jgi:diguanylate cyclase (GGDEF)-like protein
MKRKVDKFSALDPKFQEKIRELFDSMHVSIDILCEAATRDEKTGLYNNKFLTNVFGMEIEKAKRGQQKLSLLILDIDFFKKVNDKYGHVKGDEILAKLAKLLQKQSRRSDIVARFGGEEFVILLPQTNITKAKKFGTRLRNAIKNNSFLKRHKINVSGGFSEFKKGDNQKRMLARADKALYKAKNSGRDRFI